MLVSFKMADRKAELEKKKARLEQMRKERQQRQSKKGDETTVVYKNEGAKPGQDVDQLLSDLGIPATAKSHGTSSSPVASPASSVVSSQSPQHTVASPVVVSGGGSKVKLSVNRVNEVSIAPREMISYNKETQTLVSQPLEREGSSRYSSQTSSPHFCLHDLEWDDEFDAVLVFDDDKTDEDTDSIEVTVGTPPPGHKTPMPHVELAAPVDSKVVERPEKPKLPELDENECSRIMSTEAFQAFFMRTSRLMERALAEDTDIYRDYSGADLEGHDDDPLLLGERLKLSRQFYDERWSRNRTVTSIDWSTQFPELLLSTYNRNEDTHDPDGIALLWNSKFKKTTPEYIFHSQSAVMSGTFAEFHQNLILGGTYSGRIVLWDNRVNKKTPVQRTPLSAIAHTHPVFCIDVVGTQNAHNLISISSDGKMCSWSLDMLSQPQDSMELINRQGKPVAVTGMSFLSGDVNNFAVGSEECSVYTGCRHGSKAGINETFEAHVGPVTAIDYHAVSGQIDFSPYFLTSSFDWTIKLWNMKEAKPVYSFEDNTDYVFDVQWSPIHPALFASVDCTGKVDLWNLNTNTEVPSASAVTNSKVALNHCRWHSTGHHLAVGDNTGTIYLYDVGESMANPKADEWSRLKTTLNELRQNRAEREKSQQL